MQNILGFTNRDQALLMIGYASGKFSTNTMPDFIEEHLTELEFHQNLKLILDQKPETLSNFAQKVVALALVPLCNNNDFSEILCESYPEWVTVMDSEILGPAGH